MHISVTEESIAKATSLFWEQMLAMPMRAIEWPGLESGSEGRSDSGQNSRQLSRCIGPAHAFGCCRLSGAWSGTVELRLSRTLSLAATAAMLMQPVASVQEEDILDAVKEIANMVAGTIKSALPRPCVMTVPSATFEAADYCSLSRTCAAVTVFFDHPTGELMVLVRQDGEACPVVPKRDESLREEMAESLPISELAFASAGF